MKKILLPVLTLAALGIVSTSTAFADTTCPNFDGRQGRGMRNGLEVKANLFNMSIEEILEARQNGTTMLDLMEEKGITQEDMHNAMVENAKQRMADRGLSQEEIDERLQQMEERFQNRPEDGYQGLNKGRFNRN